MLAGLNITGTLCPEALERLARITAVLVPGPQHQRSARASRSSHPSRQPLTPLKLNSQARAEGRGQRYA